MWAETHLFAAVISGGLDCKLIHWDTTTRGVISTRQAGEVTFYLLQDACKLQLCGLKVL